MTTPITTIQVVGGELAVHELTGRAPTGGEPVGGAPLRTVIALHGITANALAMAPLARALPPGIRLLAPDLRGRAESRGIAGPWGMTAHADDVIAIADAYRLDSFVLLGHSMGAFVAALTAAQHPQRVSRAVLIDGGIGFPAPPETDIDALLTAIIGPAMTRLSMTFADRDAYHGFMAQNPAIAEVLAQDEAAADDLYAYLDHDLIGNAAGELVSSCVLDAIRVDGAAVVTDAETLAAAGSSTVPTRMLWAPRGLMNQTPGLYTRQLLDSAELPETMTVQQVPDCNHYSICFAPQALREIVTAIG